MKLTRTLTLTFYGGYTLTGPHHTVHPPSAVIYCHLRHFVHLSAVEVMRRRWDVLRLPNRKRFRAFPGLRLARKGEIQTRTDDRNEKLSGVKSSIKRTFQQLAMNTQRKLRTIL